MSENLLNTLLKDVRLADGGRLANYLDEYREYLENIKKYFDSEGRVVTLDSREFAYVFGDIHGDVITLVAFLQKIKFKEHLDRDGYLIFLGDYIDRGKYQYETILLLMLLQLRFKSKIILLRGNHEPPKWLIPYPHDFPYHIKSRFFNSWKELYNNFLEIFNLMPHTIISKDNILFLHGGISVNELNIHKYSHPNKDILSEILWNDPMDDYGVKPSYRGVGYLFGKDITSKFLSYNNLKLIVRGHEPCNGYMWRHNNRVLTLFSRIGEPYYNNLASVAKLPLKDYNSYRDVEIVSISTNDLPTF